MTTGSNQERGLYEISANEHALFVKSGLFDRVVNSHPIKIGDLVVSKENNIGYKVFEVSDKDVVIGADLEGGSKIRKYFPLRDVRLVNDYVKTFFELKDGAPTL